MPKPYLTIRIEGGGDSWDAAVVAQPAASTALSVGGPTGFKITIGTPNGELTGTVPQRFTLPDLDAHVKVTLTAPDETSWTKSVDVTRKQETLVAVDFTPSRGQVLVTRAGDNTPILRCGQARCGVELAAGTQVQLTAVLADGSTFGGYTQFPMRTPRELLPYLGDPLASCNRGDAITAAAAGDARDCAVTITTNTDVLADFGLQPPSVDVALLDQTKLETLVKPATPAQPPKPIDAEKLDEKPLEVAIAPPPPPPPKILQPPPPPPPTPAEKKPPPPMPPPPNMTMVEVKDDHIVDKAPDDATHLSDKNRDVDQETRAKQTNLDKESTGTAVASIENPDHTSPDVGGPKDKIRQLEETKPTTDKHIQETDHSGNETTAQGAIKGDGGENGQDGTGQHEPGMLAMRDIGGRGSLVDQGKDGKKVGKHGLPGLNSAVEMDKYERIMGKQKVDEEREVAARKMTAHKGRYERKLQAIQSSLENFVPDVRPGNQTALKTRAHPYALYIARMHRRIHELWGFGFLEDLESKGSDYPLNNPDLWTNLEVSVNPDGTVHKVTIAKTSGKTEFDVAAVDTVITAGPYEPTPEAIRSVDGRIYLRWGFYRNWRQCGTFNVEPYILSEVPDDSGAGVLDDGAMVKNVAKAPGSRKVHAPVGDKPVTPDDGLANKPVSPESTVTDKQALFAANLWVSAFATASVEKLVKYSVVPFYAAGKVAAQTSADLTDMYSGLVVESGPMKDWKLLTASEYGGSLPAGNLVLEITTSKAAFAVVLTRTNSGEYRATQLAR